MQIRRRIELYLRRTRTAPTRFGREALNDSRLVFDLRNGRELREKTIDRLCLWLDRKERRRRRR
jgi:hypothetical protein